jgi:hypothetical protein
MAIEHGETVVRHGAAAANALGLTKQVPVRLIYLTSGASRTLRLGEKRTSWIELRHSPLWQLVYPDRAAGDALRALVWAGPSAVIVGKGLIRIRESLPQSEWQALVDLLNPSGMDNGVIDRTQMPSWLAGEFWSS